ncbi:hypothetical protein ACT3TD_13810 [Corynebacterium sp. AOP36-E1-14]|uniref:hypothetical protein n=1 Tax=Corynebacterium sp. AOP36-E1-14 TaxID=3457682 RepID=UPI004034E2B8
MSEQLTYPKIAAVILAEVRAIYPNGRKPDPEITESWARALQRSRRVYPAMVWREAVTVWSISHSEVPTPHDIITAAGQVVDQWQLDPERKRQLEEFRAQRLEAKFGAGYGARESLPAGERGELESSVSRRSWRELRAEIGRRAQDRRVSEQVAAGRGDLFADMNKQPGDAPENGS